MDPRVIEIKVDASIGTLHDESKVSDVINFIGERKVLISTRPSAHLSRRASATQRIDGDYRMRTLFRHNLLLVVSLNKYVFICLHIYFPILAEPFGPEAPHRKQNTSLLTSVAAQGYHFERQQNLSTCVRFVLFVTLAICGFVNTQ